MVNRSVIYGDEIKKISKKVLTNSGSGGIM